MLSSPGGIPCQLRRKNTFSTHPYSTQRCSEISSLEMQYWQGKQGFTLDIETNFFTENILQLWNGLELPSLGLLKNPVAVAAEDGTQCW